MFQSLSDVQNNNEWDNKIITCVYDIKPEIIPISKCGTINCMTTYDYMSQLEVGPVEQKGKVHLNLTLQDGSIIYNKHICSVWNLIWLR